ncbi:arsenic-transport integral membrane protein ArsA [Mycobacterium haemophilum DSM 44634]
MSVVVVTVFVVAYALICHDRVNKTLVALAGAAIVVTLPIIDSEDVFYSHETGIDWDVIFLLLGMMIIVGVPVALLVCDRLAIASQAGLSFNDFLIHLTPIVIIVTVALIALLPRLFPGVFVGRSRAGRRRHVPGRARGYSRPRVADQVRRRVDGSICGIHRSRASAHRAVTRGDAGRRHSDHDLQAGAVRLPVQRRVGHPTVLRRPVHHVGSLVKAGVVKQLAQWTITATGGNSLLTTWLHPCRITSVPTCCGGRLPSAPTSVVTSPPSASANVVALGIAQRADNPISFWDFTRKGALITVMSLALSGLCLWVRYFVVS